MRPFSLKTMIKIVFLIPLALLASTLFFICRPLPSYDVIVIGSDPEGISAAVSSARSHSSVLLIDTRDCAGGLYTSGMLSMLDMNYAKPNSFEVVNGGFFKEFYDHTAHNANIDIQRTKNYFSKLLKDEKVKTTLGVSSITPIKKHNKVIGLSYIKNGSRFIIKGKVFIDAGIDAEFSRQSGAAYKVGREELGLKNDYAAATLVFSVQNVDWRRVYNFLNTDTSIYTGANDRVAWGYSNMLSYKPSSNRFQLRRLNLSRQDNGSVVINAFQIFNVDSLSKKNINENYMLAIKELPHIVDFLRINAPGFENAVLYKYADELYIREGVRIIGEYTLTGEDLFTNTDFKNKIAYGSYPMDLQATKKDELGGTILASRNIYSIPITVMVPKGIDNLLVVGRSASYDPLAHSSARTVPVGMALGQAAGILASYSIDHNLTVRICSLKDTHVKDIQALLTKAGVILDMPLNTNHPEQSSWAYPNIVSLRQKALLSMEYNYKNDYRCTEPADFETLSGILNLMKANSALNTNTVYAPINPKAPLTPGTMTDSLNQLLSTHYSALEDFSKAGIIDNTVLMHFKSKKVLLNEDIYAIMDNVVNYLLTQ